MCNLIISLKDFYCRINKSITIKKCQGLLNSFDEKNRQNEIGVIMIYFNNEIVR